MSANDFWVLRVYELTSDSLGAAPGLKWIFSPRESRGSEYVVYDEDTDTAVAKYPSLVEAVDAAMSSMTRRGQITISRAMLSDAGVRWGEQNVLASLDDWRRGSSFVTAAGIDQTKDQFIEYLRAVLTSRPPMLRRGAVLFMMSMIPIVIVVALIVLFFRSCA